MSRFRSTHVVFVLVALCATLAMFNPADVAVRAKAERPVAPNIRITPPAPVFETKERIAELTQRRQRVAEKIGPQSLLILFSTEPRIYSNSVNYPYRQENNL